MLGGFWADSESWGGGVGGIVYFKDDISRLSGFAGYFDVNVKFYGIGIRFMASKQHGVNLGIDYAQGKDSGV